MNREFSITCFREQIGTVTRTLVLNLPLIAIILSCALSFFLKTTIPVERPGVLLLGAFLILLPFKSEALNMLQKVATFYLVSIPVNELSSQYYTLAFPSVDVDVSYSSAILLFCTIGYLAARRTSKRSSLAAEIPMVPCAWILALVVIVAHMILLSVALDIFYGYGYEYNLRVLGNLSLYFLLFIVLWRPLGLLYFRRRVALFLVLFYVAVAVVGRGLH